MDSMGAKEEIVAAVCNAAVEVGGRNTLSCAEAFRIAETFGADLMDVGQICNENQIKLVQCQLGCFK